MNILWWIWFFERYWQEIEEEEQDDSGSSGHILIPYEPTKWDLFLKKHKIIDAVWPYVLGIMINIPAIGAIIYMLVHTFRAK